MPVIAGELIVLLERLVLDVEIKRTFMVIMADDHLNLLRNMF